MPSGIQEIKELALYLGLEGLLFEDSLFNEDDISVLIAILEISRYAIDGEKVPKSMDWYYNVLSSRDFDDNRFRSQLRMDREPFNYLIGLLKGNEAYNSTQDPIALQVAVGLYRFGSYGNSSGLKHIATKFGISEGSVCKFTTRFINALCSIKDTWIRWPNNNERNNLSMSMVEEYLPKCVGFVDGSHVPLTNTPIDNKVYYWSRKKRYSIQFQIVCDKSRLIRNFFTGFPGSVHDAKVFTSSLFGQNLHHHLTNGQFIIGDSAYPISRYVIVPFKRRGGTLPHEQSKFNKHISSHRVAVEHTIGILKGRFQSLTELRVKISGTGHEYACRWIEECCVLHNALMLKDPWTRQNDAMYLEEDEEDEEAENAVTTGQEKTLGQQKRMALLQIVNTMID